MRQKHKTFIIQILIAMITFVFGSYLIQKRFDVSPQKSLYLAMNKGVKEMATSSSALIDSLIIKNDLTFDPTSGKQLEKVLNNLKYTNKKKFILIGSSQLRTVKGEGIKGYTKIVSRKLNSHLKETTQVYNLSLGGMKISEKLILAKKGVEILDPERLLISVTPWDCISDKIRPNVKAVENKNFTYIKREVEKNPLEKEITNTKEPFPLNFNTSVTNTLDDFVGDKLPVYTRRTAIQNWLGDSLENSTEENETKNTIKLPDYWRTLNQDLDNTTGWDNEFVKFGKKSIKIIKSKSDKNAKWLGDNIVLENPTTTFDFEGWSKAENVTKDIKLYCLDFQVIFEDGTSKWHYKGLKFKKGTHDWQHVKTRVKFDKKITAIKPHMLFYGGTGTVWFDEIKAIPVYDNKIGENILPNSSFENQLKERVNVSYSYTAKEWGKIQKNMFSVVDFLSKTATNQKNVLLITPFWYTKNKSAYPQKKQYEVLLDKVKNYCISKNVDFVNASYVLSKNNFGIYTKGSVRDKIDVLHFNADGHTKLANYIIKELKL